MAQALEDFDQADRIAAANVTLNPYNIPEDENIVVPQIEPTTTNYDTLFGKIDTIPNISNEGKAITKALAITNNITKPQKTVQLKKKEDDITDFAISNFILNFNIQVPQRSLLLIVCLLPYYYSWL